MEGSNKKVINKIKGVGMKKVILVTLMLFSLTSCVTGGIGIDTDGKLSGNLIRSFFLKLEVTQFNKK